MKQAVAAGALGRDEAMPSIRQLAAQLRVNPNTVARAYSNLEREGVIRTVPACLSLFRIGENGKLDFVRKYDVDVGDRTMFWMGMVRL